jgi:predicted NAD/FAD-dependent oxidoreductase
MIYTDANITGVCTDSFGLRLRRDNKKIKSLYDAVIVTTPAPQASALLRGSPRLQHIAKSTSATPTWVAVISLKEKSGIDPDILSGQNSTLYRATRDSSKPGKNSWSRKEVWVLEANSEWSERYKDSDQSTAGRALVKAFEILTKQPMEVSSMKVRQWLHSNYQPTTNQKYLWDQDINIGVCSDWLYHQGLEGAWLSANALADRLLYYTRANTFTPVQNVAFS